jgi:hypothetical protein
MERLSAQDPMVIAASSRGVMHTANTARGSPAWIADLWAGSWFYPIAGMYREGRLWY